MLPGLAQPSSEFWVIPDIHVKHTEGMKCKPPMDVASSQKLKDSFARALKVSISLTKNAVFHL